MRVILNKYDKVDKDGNIVKDGLIHKAIGRYKCPVCDAVLKGQTIFPHPISAYGDDGNLIIKVANTKPFTKVFCENLFKGPFESHYYALFHTEKDFCIKMKAVSDNCLYQSVTQFKDGNLVSSTLTLDGEFIRKNTERLIDFSKLSGDKLIQKIQALQLLK